MNKQAKRPLTKAEKRAKLISWGWLLLSLAVALVVWFCLSIGKKTARSFPFIPAVIDGMKTMLDRANPLFPADYAFRDVYFLSTAADDEARVDARAVNGLEGWIACFPKAHLAGTVFAGGVNGVGEINGHSALEKAYEMGKGI